MADDQLGLVDLQLKGRVAHPEVEQYQARPGPGALARGRLADGGHQRVGGGTASTTGPVGSTACSAVHTETPPGLVASRPLDCQI